MSPKGPFMQPNEKTGMIARGSSDTKQRKMRHSGERKRERRGGGKGEGKTPTGKQS